MCAGCPHRGLFYTLAKHKITCLGDIGCYTLGSAVPLFALDSTLCMGASVSGLHGFNKANGGAYAIKLMNALSTGGMSVQSTKNGKGTNAVTLTGHVSIEAQEVVPMEFYDIPAPDEEVTVKVTQNLTNVTSTLSDTSAVFGNALNATLTAGSGYKIDDVVVTMGGVDVTAEVYATASGEITIAAVTGDIVITATATEE